MKKFLFLALLLLAGVTLLFVSTVSHAQVPSAGGTLRYVLDEGGVDQDNCDNPQTPCKTIGYAVSQAQNGDVIRIANKFTAAVYRENVVVNKSLSLEGGWVATSTSHGLLWRRSDPCEAFRTTIDGQHAGRALTISGVAAAVDCLTIRNGDATGLGGSGRGYDVGGGVFSNQAQLTLTNSLIENNVASSTTIGWGGGVGGMGGVIVMSHNVVDGNTASTASNGYGGGVYVRQGQIELMGNTISHNRASTVGNGWGGGVMGFQSVLTLQQNSIEYNRASVSASGIGGGVMAWHRSLSMDGDVVSHNDSVGSGASGDGGGIAAKELDDFVMKYAEVSRNSAPGQGGGLYLQDVTSTEVSFSEIHSNSAQTGGGVYVAGGGNALLQQSFIESNRSQSGGGVYVSSMTGSFYLDNTLVAGNSTSPAAHGAGLYLMTPHVFLRHDTFVSNAGISGVAAGTGQITMQNCIIANHALGLIVQNPGHAMLRGTLWWHNSTDYSGAVTTSSPNLHADPQFVDSGCGDYHLKATSPAIDAGVNAAIVIDIDGDPRPVGAGYDIGADEYGAAHLRLPLVLR